MNLKTKITRYYLLIIFVTVVIVFHSFDSRYRYEYSGKEEYINSGKSIYIFDCPDFPEEEIILYNFVYQIESDFEKLLNLYEIADNYQIIVRNLEENEAEGYYVQRYEIHNLKSAEVKHSDDYYIQQAIERKEYEKYSLVTVLYFMEWSEDALKKSPQYENGRYQRDFLCGFKNGTWKICEIGMLEVP